jgi:UDP-glucose 4-epimerase
LATVPLKICSKKAIAAVIHFAGLKAVDESARIPIAYYPNSITGTLILLELMTQSNVKQIHQPPGDVYGLNAKPPNKETDPLAATNPYGCTKLFIEQILTAPVFQSYRRR